MTFSGHIARKRFGQHWLIDNRVLQKILVAADIKPDDRVLEVGPGRGALTEILLSSPAALVHAIEIDRDLVNGLKRRFIDEHRFTLEEGDVLSADLLLPDGLPANKVIANIPYNITGPLLNRFLGRLGQSLETTYKLIVLLLQKEVADRILAEPGQSCFSALSVRVQLMAHCRRICLVPPRCFSPPPKVQSTVISIRPLSKEESVDPVLANSVESLLKKAFLSRRKMLRNSLGGLRTLNELEVIAERAGISLSQRPQELSPKSWLSFAKELTLN